MLIYQSEFVLFYISMNDHLINQINYEIGVIIISIGTYSFNIN